MNNSRTLEGGGSLQGIIEVPGDKSISHRALILGSIAEGQTTISGFLNSEDPISTANCLRNLGVKITDIVQENCRDHKLIEKVLTVADEVDMDFIPGSHEHPFDASEINEVDESANDSRRGILSYFFLSSVITC